MMDEKASDATKQTNLSRLGNFCADLCAKMAS